ncbi:hypothetical protein B0F90DRAFT_1736888 [Multifurca ochricompacta]|uniref:Tetratricopeptide repeat protein 29 n=1 Tax=Multifurca ochricompacta TaxID=376703 RepID=A0AAD4QM29_9AGAM|nr:hypothetical protein B0F90DRAFT_1736888 [Multifurca ochricompacta]
MAVRSFSFRQTARRVFNTYSTYQQPAPGPLKPISSEPISGQSDVAMSQDPYIAPIAGLLLQALRMRDEVKQCKEEWEVVMQKLASVASVVVDVGESCQTHNLKEEDLPTGLRTILRSLRNDLQGIEDALKESSSIGGMRKFLLRADILRKIKQYDGKLSNVLQTFQAKLVLDSRFAQIVQDRKNNITNTGATQMATSVPLAPLAPQIFFGRDAELVQIIDMIFTNAGSHPARIAILGPGGYGKTTLANALGKTFGNLQGAPDALWSQINATLNAKESILCLDNFESPWDQPDDTKYPIEELLSRITGLRRVTVLITMRGVERPAQTEWTQPFLEPLGTLNLDAAKEVWRRITGNYDTFSEKLITAVDYVPLAVNLLAHLSQSTPPMLLWEEWNAKQTKVIKRGQMHRLSNLEYSIQLSIDSERMKLNPLAKDLLGVLSMLPDGIHMRQLGKFKGILVDVDVISCLQVLQQCSLIRLTGERYQPHPIIRQFCRNHGFASSTHKALVEDFYISLAAVDPYVAPSEAYAELVLEANNTKAIIFDLLKSNYENHQKLIYATAIQFAQKNQANVQFDMETAKSKLYEAERLYLSSEGGNAGQHAYTLLTWAETSYQKALELHSSANNVPAQGDGHYALGELYLRQNKMSEAEASFHRALEFHNKINNLLGQGNDYQGLGDMYLRLDRLDEAETSYKRALELHIACNHISKQGNALRGLGDIYLHLRNYNEAEASFQRAFELHKAINDIICQGSDCQGLGDTCLQLQRFDEAEHFFHQALELYGAAKNVFGQGNAYNKLGKLHLAKSELEEAKRMFEEAKRIHKEVQSKGWEMEDQWYMDQVLSRMEQLAIGPHSPVDEADDKI